MVEIASLTSSHHAQVLDIYNHYVSTTPITFDIEPFTVETRQPWFDQFGDDRHRCFVGTEAGEVLGYACSMPFKPKAAYATSVEASIYLSPNATGKGLGKQLYAHLFEVLATQPVHRVYAGITQPNAASLALHLAFGFKQIGYYTEVGYKFDRYWDVAWYEKPLP